MKRGSSNNPSGRFSRAAGRGSSSDLTDRFSRPGRLGSSGAIPPAISRPGRRGSSAPGPEPISRCGQRGSSASPPPGISRSFERGSSAARRFARGGRYLPILLSGPTATPALTTCNIAWELDPAGPAGYHRVRHKRPSGEWTVTAWSGSASHSASVDISGLTPEHTGYFYDIQSCIAGDGSAAFDWHPGDESAYFYTTCTFPLVYSNIRVAISEGPFKYLEYRWDTQVNADQKEVRWKEGLYGGYNYLGPAHTQATHHIVNDLTFKFDVGPYYYNVRNQNMCGAQNDWSVGKGFYIDAEGDIGVQW